MKRPLSPRMPVAAVAAACVLTTLGLSACAPTQPLSQSSAGLTLASTWHAPLPAATSRAISPDWSVFSDPILQSLLDGLWQDSPSWQQAVARLDQARAAAGVSVVAPQLQLSAQAQRSRPTQPPQAAIQHLSLAQLDARWEVDLFAQARQQQQALSRRAEAASRETDALRLSLAAELANSYLALRSAEQLLALADEEVSSTERLAGLAAQRGRVGLESQGQVALMQAAAAEAAQRRLAQAAEVSVLIKSLVALTALPEPALRQRLAPATARWPEFRPFDVPGIPADVLKQRPDVAAAQAAAEAAWAEAGAAQAARYPQLQLLGSVSLLGLKVGDQRDEQRGWSFGPQLSLPLWDGGARRAEAEAAQARWRQAEAAWRQQVLTAVREVEEALVRLQSTQARDALARRSVADYEKALSATESRWRAGLASATELEEQRRLTLAARSSLSLLQREHLSAWLALHKAVGGGWQAPT